MTEDPPVIVDAHGRPARKGETEACPRCGAGVDRRVPSSGFGTAHPVCTDCGFEWHDEVFRGPVGQ